MARELTAPTKQAFQVVSLISTVMVVAIHYQSAAPSVVAPSQATWNELAQEFLMGGIARVAVPLFAIAAGVFYFLSDDGTRATYLRKLRQRSRTVLFPYFLVSSVALVSWLVVRRLEGDPVTMSAGQFVATWLLRPPAEQLWFVRDLVVLVLAAPLIRFAVERFASPFLIGLAALWFANVQPFPQVAGWHLLHIETLFFFAIGAWLAREPKRIESFGRFSPLAVAGLWLVWCDLILARIFLRADFDLWYIHDYEFESLVLYKLAIPVGCLTIAATSRLQVRPRLVRLSGLAFYVYLVHEFPLRAAIERFAAGLLAPVDWFWLTAPIALAISFGSGLVLNRLAPGAFALLTGGRTPRAAMRVSACSVDPPADASPVNARTATATSLTDARDGSPTR